MHDSIRGVWERLVIREELTGEVERAVSPSEHQEIVGDRMLRTRGIDGCDRAARVFSQGPSQ